MKDELMSGVNGASHYPALTIAAMGGHGLLQRVTTTVAEPMVCGWNAGGGLLTGEVRYQRHLAVPGGVLRVRRRHQDGVCMSHCRALGRCGVLTHSARLPPRQSQYFSNLATGGSDDMMDCCPYVQGFGNTTGAVDRHNLKGSVLGVASMYLDAPAGYAVCGQTYTQTAICAAVWCAATTYIVKVSGAKRFCVCKPGSKLSLSSLSNTFTGGEITHPSNESLSVCDTLVCVNTVLDERYTAMLANRNAEAAPAAMTAALAAAAIALALLVG
ncbi:Leishmanolysin [Novymonas esmeraldas]|uniref:Leishmanolysin-like peptidase n=1 Tax=Novymonas esmeraldas TaxID=1808958 RepID=A0AAW0EZY0_9TRYP